MSYLESCSAAQAGPWSWRAALYAAQEAVGDGHGELCFKGVMMQLASEKLYKLFTSIAIPRSGVKRQFYIGIAG